MNRGLSRRALLRGVSRGVPAALALPPLQAMFDGSGRAYAEDRVAVASEARFVLWFNGNGIPEKFWIPAETGAAFKLTPCLAPLAPFRNDIHVLSGLDNAVTRMPGPGNGHTNSMGSLMCCAPFNGRGAGGPSIDQMIAAKVGGASRFRSLQVGVASESFGESMQRNMSWVAQNRPLPPELLPHRLFDRLFGQREMGWVARQKSVLDAVRADALSLRAGLGKADRDRLDDHLGSVRELELTINSLPPAYRKVDEPSSDGDTKDWPRVAKLQSQLLVHALASKQTRVASYMLTKCQSLTRFPWLGHTVLRHHDYTHYGKIPGTQIPAVGALRDICRWHVEELAYLLGLLRGMPEGEGTLLDHTCLLFMHEHAEANPHKNSGHGVVVAGRAAGLKGGMHSHVAGTIADLYMTVASRVMRAEIDPISSATQTLSGIWSV